jgi:RimJ/RimL family protein N-acetyltransferase
MPWAKFEPQSVFQREELILHWNKDWDEKKDFPFGVFRRDQLVGSSGLHLRHGDGHFEIGYWVRTSCVGQGIATRTTRALTDAAFALPEVQEVLIAHDIANTRSQFIPKSLGFTVVKEYDTDKNSDSATGRNKLWVMMRETWSGI